MEKKILLKAEEKYWVYLVEENGRYKIRVLSSPNSLTGGFRAIREWDINFDNLVYAVNEINKERGLNTNV